MTTKKILTLMADSIAVMGNGRIEVCGAKKAVFASPGTRTGAMLTGCKNISRLKKLGEHRVRALDWGMELTVDHAADTAGYVGIRMHDLRVGGDKNVIRCHVVEEIENPFSVTVMLRPVGTEDTIPVGWETDKETWDRLRTDELDICLPVESLLLLEGGRLCGTGSIMNRRGSCRWLPCSRWERNGSPSAGCFCRLFGNR